MKQLSLPLLVVVCCSLMMLSTVASMIVIWSVHQSSPPQLTGKASQSGEVRLEIANFLSIVVDDSLINFSGCSPGRIIYSDTHFGNEYLSCPQFSPDSISVRNDGDVHANVTLNISNWGEAHGGTFLPSPHNSSYVLYSVKNGSTNPLLAGGCLEELQESWVNVTSADFFPVCGRLQPHAVNNSVRFDIGLFIPLNASSGTSELVITFFASEP